MGAGTPSFGGRHNKSHTICRRCGKRSFHIQKKRCSACGYPDAQFRHFTWAPKAHRKTSEGAGRMTHLKSVYAKLRAIYTPK